MAHRAARPKPTGPERAQGIRILGVRVDPITTQQLLDTVLAFVAERRPRQIVTVNPEFVMLAQQDAAFHVVLDEADLSLADGAGLLWAARWMGQTLPERVTGSDSVPLIARLCAQHGLSLFLLGAAEGVAEQAARLLAQENPGLKIAGTYAGSPSPAEEDQIVAMIRAVQPDFLFVAYGAPRQDLWIHRNLARLQVPVCMGVGGSLDFIVGITPRAPLWMREHGLEWLYRLIQQPWRWRRMLALPRFVVAVMLDRFLRR